MHDPLQGAQPPQGQAQHYDPNLSGGQHFGVAPMAPDQDGWGKIGVVMVALAVVFAGGVAYFIATSGSAKDDEAAAMAATSGDAGAVVAAASGDAGAAAAVVATAADADATANTELADPVEAPTVAVEGEDAGPAAADIATDPDEVGGQIGLLRENGEVDRPAGLISLAIESEPPGASVIRKRDGVRLGTTPYRYEVETSRADVAFVLKLEGYRSMSVSMPGDKDGVRQVMLLPGSGGVVIPAPSTIDSEDDPTPSKPKPVAVKDAPKKPTPTSVSKPKRPSRPKRPSKPKQPSKPKPPKKPKGGTVDYKADPIPL